LHLALRRGAVLKILAIQAHNPGTRILAAYLNNFRSHTFSSEFKHLFDSHGATCWHPGWLKQNRPLTFKHFQKLLNWTISSQRIATMSS